MNYKIDVRHLLPVNTSGSANNAAAFQTFHSEAEAFDKFRSLSRKLLQINDWKVNAGKNPTDFYLHNKEQEKLAFAEMNDLVKIKMPAPKNQTGKGFDWVVINKLDSIEDTGMKVLLLQMKPHSCAENMNDQIAHFYTEDATNNFILAKKGKTVQLSIHGRNEIPNVKNIGFLNSCRNFFVANGGIFGGSKVQWQDFAEEFIKK